VNAGLRLRPRPRKLALLRWLPSTLVVSSADAGTGAVFLTFDDGPHPVHTPPVLDALARHGAQATFFLIGDLAQRHPDLVRRIAAEGHGIGNHSHTHPEFRGLPLARQMEEIERADAALRGIVGAREIPFRTPRGALPPRLVSHLAARGRPIVYWSYDTLDYRRPDPAQLIDMLRAQPPRAGDIVLMHDDGPAAGAILDAVLPQWRGAGLAVRGLPAGVGTS
jgi:peptidoglycan/xylan/chitin deacetylase (PgdA/CDA1 family)